MAGDEGQQLGGGLGRSLELVLGEDIKGSVRIFDEGVDERLPSGAVVPVARRLA